jgi:hypothetical protein
MAIAGTLLCVFAASGVHAQQSDSQLPDAPTALEQPRPTSTPPQSAVVFHTKAFWTLVAVDAASAVADAQTSWHNEQKYSNSYEQNSWLYGRRPSLGRYYATFAVIDGGGALLSYHLLHSRHKLARCAGWALLGGLVAQHTEGWIYNASAHATILYGPQNATVQYETGPSRVTGNYLLPLN